MADEATDVAMQQLLDSQVTLLGHTVRLEPLSPEHSADLYKASCTVDPDNSFWRYLPVPQPTCVEDTLAWIQTAAKARDAGTEIPLAIVRADNGTAIGSTRFMDIQAAHRSVEIGWTWLGHEYHRTIVNTECKYLMLQLAFEAWQMLRVQLKTDGRNTTSQRAIARLGAMQEGTLRKHRINWDGYVRDTVYFSIIADEWPDVKARLEMLQQSK